MRVKVIRDFIDKETKALHKAGSKIEVTKGRYEEINSTAHGIFVEVIPAKKQTKAASKK